MELSPNLVIFVPSRLIIDNAIVGYKCMHKLRVHELN